MCTVVGTTTNLVVDGMMISETGKGMPIFEIGKVGLPIAIVGLIYIIFASRYLLLILYDNVNNENYIIK